MRGSALSRVVVVICTHNPDAEKFVRVLESIFENKNTHYRVVIIENASSKSDYLSQIKDFPVEILVEEKVGNSYARHTGMQQQLSNELLIFVDDDNLLSSNYFENALDFSNQFRDVGVFGGQSHPSHDLKCPSWKLPLLPYLGIRTLEKQSPDIQNSTLHWNEAQPIGAGMCIRPEVTRHFLASSQIHKYFALGRVGKKTCSGEDSFIANQCAHLGLRWAITKDLNLIHEINQKRLDTRYLVRLLFNYGYSDVILDSANSTTPSYPYPRSIIQALARYIYFARNGRSGMIIGLRQIGIYFASRKLRSSKNALS
jgi:hypothetical protein